MKKATYEEWQEIGRQAKIAREELFKLVNMSSGKLPLAITKYIQTSINALDRFRCDAENRMFRTGIADTKIFYGQKED